MEKKAVTREITLLAALTLIKKLKEQYSGMMNSISYSQRKTIEFFGVDFLVADEEILKGSKVKKEEFIKACQSNFDYFSDLLSKITTLDAQIKTANVVTKMTVNDKQYTIVEALSKFSRLDTEISFYEALKNAAVGCYGNIDQYKETQENKFNDHIKTMDKITDVTISTLKKEIVKEITVVDPIVELKMHESSSIEYFNEKIQELKDFKDAFHIAINEINAVTKITVNW